MHRARLRIHSDHPNLALGAQQADSMYPATAVRHGLCSYGFGTIPALCHLYGLVQGDAVCSSLLAPLLASIDELLRVCHTRCRGQQRT